MIESFFNFFANTIGAGDAAVARAYRYSGLGLGIIGQVFVVTINNYAMLLLVRIAD